ncbi:MAG: GPR endopeptidase [Lachnospiraceae bacterium]|nr:GPR endopeptidase [Lachnospiraceae bacterium]
MRTDIALEACLNAAEEITGAEWTQENGEDKVVVSTVKITTPEGAKRLGRPMGKYITLECPYLRENTLEIHERIIEGLTKIWKDFLDTFSKANSILVVGLGNRRVTADALGPQVVDQVLATRHIREQLPKEWKGNLGVVSALAPGVMGQTGIETGEIIEALVKAISPDVVIAIDALAAGSIERLVNTIQICDTGIQPGAGMGNRRRELSEKTLGVPVLAVGVPTVVDASDIAEKEDMDAYYVTPKDMDVVMKRLSLMIASSLNRALHRLSPEELKAYLY